MVLLPVPRAAHFQDKQAQLTDLLYTTVEMVGINMKIRTLSESGR